ncbi:MAG TPA: homocysteine S-methyltransferase family protein, partial [Candidatus Acidoferrales bacterium]
MCGAADCGTHESQTRNPNGEQGINPQIDVGRTLNKRASEAHPMVKVSASDKNSTKKMKSPVEQSRILDELLRERILVLDGAMGTMIQKRDLSAADFGGAKLEGCNENLVITRPD